MTSPNYVNDYENNWKNLVENEAGTLNKDAVMRLLSDFSEAKKEIEEGQEFTFERSYVESIVEDVIGRLNKLI